MGYNKEHIAVQTCARHPKVETRLSCARCEIPICTDCMVYTSVGLRCADCVGQAELPVYTVGKIHLFIAITLGGILSLMGASLWILLPTFLSRFGLGFYGLIAMISVAHFTAYLMSLALKGKQGRELQIIGGGTVILGYMIALPFMPTLFNSYAIFSLVLGVVVAVLRFR